MSELSELTSPPSRSASPLAIARSLVIALALMLAALQAAPTKPLNREQLELPINARPIAAIEHALDALGFQADGAITNLLIEVTKNLTHLRHVLLRPFNPVFEELSMGQRWGLFTSKGSTAYRIQIEGLTATQDWKLLYRAHEVDLLGLEDMLSYRRLRGIYDPHSKDEAKAQYEPFANWLSRDVLAKHPEYVGVRVSMERLKLGTRSKPTEVLSVEHNAEIYRDGTP